MRRQTRSRRSTREHPVMALYDAYQDGILAVEETAAFRQHLATCGECQGWMDRQGRLIERLQVEDFPLVRLSPAAAARIQQDVTKRMRRALMVNNVKSTVGAAVVVATLVLIVGIFILNSRNLDNVEIAQPSVSDAVEVIAPGEVSDELLIEAVNAADPVEVKRLLEAGVSPELRDSSGRSLLDIAIVGSKISGDTEILELLVKYGADAEELERRVFVGRIGASAGVIELLMESGTDVNRLLPLAAEGGLLESVQLLLGAGADPNGTKVTTGPFAGDYPAIALAVFSNSPKMVELLIEKGADVNKGDGTMKRTALHTAAFLNHPEIAQLLIDNGADVNARSTFMGGTTPLSFAIVGRSRESIQVLIDSGADVNAQSALGLTPLMDIFENLPSGGELVASLLDAGADPNLQDGIGLSALHYASEKGDAAAVSTLIEYGADVNLANDKGETPLDLAATEEVAEVLRQAGAGG